MNGTTLYECMECGKVFRRKLHKEPGDIHCPICGGTNVEVYSPPTPKEMKWAFDQATQEMIA